MRNKEHKLTRYAENFNSNQIQTGSRGRHGGIEPKLQAGREIEKVFVGIISVSEIHSRIPDAFILLFVMD